MTSRLSVVEDDFGMEQAAGHTGRDGDQVGLVGEDFNLAGAGEFGEVDGASVADAGGCGSVSSNAGKLWEQLARVDKERLDWHYFPFEPLVLFCWFFA
ncbi:MAG: hypothetical protein WA252_09610 [Candidatus Sulfotelmatobacter sp.]